MWHHAQAWVTAGQHAVRWQHQAMLGAQPSQCLGGLGGVVISELHRKREKAALPVGISFSRDIAFPAHQVDTSAGPCARCSATQVWMIHNSVVPEILIPSAK